MAETIQYADQPKPAGSVFMGQVTPIGVPPNGRYTINGQLTNAQVLTGNSVPVDAIPAVPGKIILPKSIMWRFNYAVAYGANRQWSLRYSGGSTIDLTTAAQIVNTVVPKNDINWIDRVQSINLGTGFDPTGVKVIFFASADATLGDPANQFAYQIEYLIVDRPPF